MKKTLLTLAIIWVALFFVLSFLDSGNYAMEKRLWYAQKQFEIIARDPKAVPDKNFDDLVSRYEGIIKSYPNSLLTPKIYIKIGNLRVLQKDYARARNSYKEILSRYSKNESLCAEALLYIGNSYADEKNVEMALKTFQEAQDKYPLTIVGINMPLYIADYQLRNKHVVESANSLRTAITFYQKIGKEHPNSDLEFQSRWLLATTYFAQQKWETGIQILQETLLDYAKSQYLTPQNAVAVIKTINTTAAVNLKNYDLAIDYYKKFIEKYPGHPLNEYLKINMKGLEDLRDKKVTFKVNQKQPGQR